MRNDIMEQARAIRKSMDAAASVLTDEQAASAPMIYRAWDGNGADYAVGDRVQYSGYVYKCLTAHTSQEAWTPTDAPSLIRCGKALWTTTYGSRVLRARKACGRK